MNHEITRAESGTHVRSVNPLYRAFGVGRVLKVKDRLCKVEFNPSVFSRPPFRSQNYILGLDEVAICPAPLELAKGGNWDDAWKFDLRRMAARFRHSAGHARMKWDELIQSQRRSAEHQG